MNAEKLLEALKTKNYSIAHSEGCGCNFAAYIDNHDELVVDGDGCECWVGNALMVDGEEILLVLQGGNKECHDGELKKEIGYYSENLREALMNLAANEEEEDEIEELYCEFRDEMAYESDCVHESHLERKNNAIVYFIQDNNYKTYLYYPRNFNNEYDCLLLQEGVAPDESWEECTPEDWADHFTRGDRSDSQQWFIGFNFVQA